MPRIISIQFSTAGKLYDFNAGDIDVAPGERVIVETERGLSIGQVMRPPVERPHEGTEKLIAIKRKANSDDLATLERNRQKEKEAFDFCLRRIVERNMQMKLVRVEYLFDSSKAVFFFTADGRVDFRDLVKDLAHTFHTRIEMRQIGVRDESKITGGIGICGRELCCCSWLRDFQPVSVKMAKEQNLALNPSKISGQCGRLLCCLDYEYETYCCLRKTFPKCGKRVKTSSVHGVVDKLNILTGTLTLRMDDGKQIVVRRDEVIGEATAEDIAAAAAAKAEQQPRQEQRDRQRPQRQQPPRNQEKKSQSGDASARKESVPKEPKEPREPREPKEPKEQKEQKVQEEGGQQRTGKRRSRNRRHGHRKQGGGTAPAADSGSTPPTGRNDQ